MATSGSRDIKLRLSVETLGEDGLRQIAAELRRVAAEGGAAAPEFERLANEIEKLGQQGEAVNTFQRLAEETAQLALRQEAASEKVVELRTKLEDLRAKTVEAAAAQQKAQQDYAQGTATLDGIKVAIQALKLEYDAAGRKTEEFATRMLEAKTALIEQGREVTNLGAALRQSNTELGKAERAQDSLEKKVNSSATAAGKLENSLRSSNSALEAASAAVQEYGLSTDNVAATQVSLATAVAKVNQEIEAANATRRAGIAAVQEEEAAQRQLILTLNNQIQQIRQSAAAREEAAVASQRLADADRQAQQASAQWQTEAEQLVNTVERQQRATIDAAAAVDKLTNDILRLDAQNAFAKQAAEMEEMVRKAARLRDIEAALAAADAEAEQLAASARRVNDAFDALGVRNLETIHREILETRNAMDVLADRARATGTTFSGAFAAGEARIAALQREARELTGTLTTADKAAKLFASSLGQIAVGNLIANGVGYLVNKVKDLGREFIDVIVKTESFRRGLQAVYKDAKVASDQFEFLKKKADEAGIGVAGIQQSFLKFAAATQSANIPLEVTNDLFAAVTRAAGTLGLGAEAVDGILNALGQTASKGVVSLEELRAQLGDRLPGAMSLTAKGLGITDAQLIKLVESGQLAARDFFPALTKGLKELQGQADGLAPTFERLKNILTETSQTAGDSTWTAALTGGLKVLSAAAAGVGVVFTGVSEAISIYAKTLAIFFANWGDWSRINSEVSEMLDEAAARQSKYNDSIGKTVGTMFGFTDAQNASNAAMVKAGENAATLIKANGQVAASEQLKTLATKLSGDATLDAGMKMVQFNVAAAELLGWQQKNTEAMEKSAKAVKATGDALVEIAKLRGDEQEILKVSTEAAIEHASALERVAVSQKEETAILESQLAMLKERTAVDAEAAKALDVQVQALEKKIVVSKAETEQAVAAAEASKVEVAQRRLAAAAYEDNSKRVEEFRKVIEATQRLLAEYEAQEKLGLKTAQEVMVVRRQLAQVQGLYKDSLNDSIAAEDRKMRAESAALQVTLAKTNAEIKHADSMAAQAKASGNYALALSYEIQSKQKQIDAIRLTIKIKELETAADLKRIEIERLLITGTDAVSKAKREELDIRIQLIKVKQIETQALAEQIRTLESETDTLRRNGVQRGGVTSGIDKDTESRYKNKGAIDAQTEALEKQNRTADGLKKNKDGSAAGTFNNTLPTDQAFAAFQATRGGPAFTGDPAVARKQAEDAWTWLQKFMQNGGVASPQAINDAQAMVNATRNLPGGPAGPQPINATGATPGSTHVVAVSINGKPQTPVNAASEADADNLARMLKNLEQSSSSAVRT